jgi:hypothetical protein
MLTLHLADLAVRHGWNLRYWRRWSTTLTRCAALLGWPADPGGEQVPEADHPVDAPPLHDGQVTEAVQEHDLGRVLDRRVRAR